MNNKNEKLTVKEIIDNAICEMQKAQETIKNLYEEHLILSKTTKKM